MRQAVRSDAKTVAGYLDLLVDLLLVRRLEPWHSNAGKRLVKSPRIYVRDSGLVHTLLGLTTSEDILGHPIAGPSWEGLVVETLIAAAPGGTRANFYRTSAGAEIDLVLTLPGDPAQTPAECRDARNQLVTALADYALHHGIGEYVGVAEAGWYHTISKFGWTCRALGSVHRDSACRILALSIAIDEETLPGLQRTGTYAPLVLKFEEGGEPGR